MKPKRPLAAFDFDGTFYPIDPYDSEQLLMLRNAENRGRTFMDRAQRAVERDRNGGMDWRQFTAAYRTFAKGSTERTVASVADTLAASVKEGQFSLIPDLARYADLAIISCGTEDIVRAFLERFSLLPYFGTVLGKQFVFTDGRVTDLAVHVWGPEDKKRHLDALGKTHDALIAVGDGPTDAAMLDRSDFPLLVDWGKSRTECPYTKVFSIGEAVRTALNFLRRD